MSLSKKTKRQLWLQIDLLRNPCGPCISIFNWMNEANLNTYSGMRCDLCQLTFKDRVARAEKEGFK